MGQFCLLLRHFLRKLKDACLFKAVLCQKTWNLLGLMDKKRNIFVLKRVKSFLACKYTINKTILNILLILSYKLFKTLKRMYMFNLIPSDKTSETLFLL